jgi:hypothetical protein
MATDDPSTTLRLTGVDGQVVIRVLSREAADPAGPYWDANWLTTSVEVGTPHFSVRLRAALKADELAEFLLELRRLAAGEARVARFRSIEGWLSLDLTEQDGSVLLDGLAKEPSNPANELRFAVADIRDPDVSQLASNVERILDEFPVLGRRDQ